MNYIASYNSTLMETAFLTPSTVYHPIHIINFVICNWLLLHQLFAEEFFAWREKKQQVTISGTSYCMLTLKKREVIMLHVKISWRNSLWPSLAWWWSKLSMQMCFSNMKSFHQLSVNQQPSHSTGRWLLFSSGLKTKCCQPKLWSVKLS